MARKCSVNSVASPLIARANQAASPGLRWK